MPRTDIQEIDFKRWLYMLGVEDGDTGAFDRFTPKPNWMTDEERLAYLAGRSDQATNQVQDHPGRL